MEFLRKPWGWNGRRSADAVVGFRTGREMVEANHTATVEVGKEVIVADRGEVTNAENALCNPAGDHAEDRPNIMVIHCHDLGRHLGCYGRSVDTPNIDRLATAGVRFDNCFGTAPYCAPSRCSRMTGLYPVNHGAMGVPRNGWSIRQGIRTLPMYMNEAGYDTYLFGLQHESHDPTTLGYQHVEHGSPNASPYAMDVVPAVLEFLDNYDPEAGVRFYADVGFSEVHSAVPVCGLENWWGSDGPHRFKPIYIGREETQGYTERDVVIRVDNPEDPYFREYAPGEVEPLPYLPDRPGIRADLADLQSLITCVLDVAVGRILDKLRERGLERDTLVVFTTDHGIEMPRAKGTLYDPGIEITLLMRYPRRFPQGKVCDELLSNVDLLPTLVDLVGGPVPANIDGRSFLPLLDGRPYEERGHLNAENTRHGVYWPMRGIRTGRFKYIRNFYTKGAIIWSGEAMAYREVLGLLYHRVQPLEELYDRARDPYEQSNLAPERTLLSVFTTRGEGAVMPADPEYREALRSLRKQLKAHMRETNDPLLRGPVPHPGYQYIWDES